MRKSKAGHGKMWRMRRGRMLRKRRKMAEQWQGFPIFWGGGALVCSGSGDLGRASGLRVLLSSAQVVTS